MKKPDFDDSGLYPILEKVDAGERVSPEEGLWLASEAPLLALGEMARLWQRRHNPEPRVTFVVDTNPNYTNYCYADCLFCAFYRKPGDADEGYAHDVDELMALVEEIEDTVNITEADIIVSGGIPMPDLNGDNGVDIVDAIIGYSLNDTIIIYDRIRENMKLRRKESYREVINRSINECLSRTVLTSLTTFFVAAVLATLTMLPPWSRITRPTSRVT